MPTPPTDPFSEADQDGNWLLWPMKTWPLNVRIPLILLLILVFTWFAIDKPLSAPVVPVTPTVIEESIVTPDEQVLGSESSAPSPVDCSGPFTLMTTTLQQFAACADVVGVERHELTCGQQDCTNRRGCPTLDENGRLLYFLMEGEYIAILQDGRLIRSDGELPADTVGSTRCERQPP